MCISCKCRKLNVLFVKKKSKSYSKETFCGRQCVKSFQSVMAGVGEIYFLYHWIGVFVCTALGHLESHQALEICHT